MEAEEAEMRRQVLLQMEQVEEERRRREDQIRYVRPQLHYCLRKG